MSGSVILGAARTPIGRLLGSLKDFSGAQLGGVAIKAALERAGVAPEQVQYTIMGQVLTAGAGQIPARQAAVAAGIGMDVPALTINKVCLSGLDAIALADQLIRAGEFDIVVAGGQESMTQAPHLLPKSRSGFKYGDTTLVDHMAYDGLFCAFDQVAMGASTEKHNTRYGVTRAAQDEFSARSHQRRGGDREGLVRRRNRAGPGAPAQGRPGAVQRRRGRARRHHRRRARQAAARVRLRRHHHRGVGVADLRRRRRGRGREQGQGRGAGLTALAEIGAHGVVAGPDASLHEQPSNAINAALAKAGLDASALDLVEINEAFAAVGLVSTEKLGLDPEKVNVNGGAIALGHPIGASGARLAVHLVHELARRGGGLGAAALCGGGGQGDALLLRVPGR